jgi:L-amino acid N-acyltransferase YncA
MALAIRCASANDAAQVQEIYAPFCRDTPISFETEPPVVEVIRRRIVETLKALPWLVCDQDGLILGYAYASTHRERAAYRWSVDVSVYIREGHRRRGIGRALYTSLFALLRLQGFQNAIAGATLPNPSSVALHEAMGFQPVGVYRNIGYKCGSWHDVKWWQLMLRDRDGASAPAEPLGLQEVLDSPAGKCALHAGLAAMTSGS